MQDEHHTQFSDLGWIIAQTEGYLSESTTSEKLNACAKSTDARVGIIALDQLKHTGGQTAIYKGAPMLVTHYIKRDGPRNIILGGFECEEPGQKIIVVTGMAGCGKTQLITDVSREVSPDRSPRFGYVFFVDGSSEASIEVDLITHVKHALPIGSDVNLTKAMSFFQNPHNSKWLIAFDNVDDVNIDLPKFFPQCDHGAILVTSRNQSLGLLASEPQFHLQLDIMSQDEAIEVITKSARRPRLSPGESKAVSDITERLGYLPIALSQAGCYMAEAGCSAAEYLELLSESRVKLLDRPSRTRQKECAYAALDISYKRLPTYIQKFIHLLSFYHFANFPMSTISQAAANAFRQDPFPFAAHGPEFETQIQLLNEIFLTDGEWTNFKLQDWILVLQSYSMASFTTNSDTKLLRIHPLIRDWAFDRLSSERRVEFQGAALRLLAACMDEGRDLRLLPPHAAAFLSRSDPEYLSINDRAALGKILRGQDQNAAQAIWLPIYNTLRLEYGIDHLHVATAALETAEAYGEMNLEQAEELESEAIRIRTLSLGPRHLDTLKATVSLSGTWYYQGKYQKAFEKIEHCLKFMKEQLSAAHPYVLRIEKVFAGMQMKQHNNRESEVVQQRILETLIAERGETHPETLFAMLILGWTQGKSGHYSEAEALLERVVELRKTLSGEADGATLAAMATLAGTYHEHGRYADAEAVQLKILEQRIARIRRR